jgi:chorismate mutase
MAGARDIRGRVTKVVRGRAERSAAGASEPLPVSDGVVQELPAPATAGSPGDQAVIDLKRRRAQLGARVAELQFDLGGLVYEMAIRDRIRVDVLVKRAAQLQDADAELGEVERILRLEETSTAGACANCGAPHSSGAAYCWQCGQPLLLQVPSHAIG